MNEVKCPICKLLVASGPDKAAVKAAGERHQAKRHPVKSKAKA